MSGGREPQRTCVGCRASGPTIGLVRLVRSPAGEVAIDPSCQAPGRGAWVHPRPACVEAALARGALAGALRAGVGEEVAGRLRERSNEQEQEQA